MPRPKYPLPKIMQGPVVKPWWGHAGREYLADILDRHMSCEAHAKYFRTSTQGRMTRVRCSDHPHKVE